jgi:hypothetical protein
MPRGEVGVPQRQGVVPGVALPCLRPVDRLRWPRWHRMWASSRPRRWNLSTGTNSAVWTEAWWLFRSWLLASIFRFFFLFFFFLVFFFRFFFWFYFVFFSHFTNFFSRSVAFNCCLILFRVWFLFLCISLTGRWLGRRLALWATETDRHQDGHQGTRRDVLSTWESREEGRQTEYDLYFFILFILFYLYLYLWDIFLFYLFIYY